MVLRFLYLIDCNATRAYKAAYPHIKNDRVAKSAGNRLLTFVDIKAYIDERLDEISSEKIADATEVMKYLTSVLRGESTAEIVVVEGVGDGMSEARSMTKKPDETQRLKAAELLGKRYGLFKENVKLEGAVPVIIKDDIPETDDYKNTNERTAFVFADAMGVVEVRAKDTDDHTEYVIYWYIDRIDKGQKKIKRIQVWDKSQVTYFVQVDEGKIEKDKDEPINPRPHVVYEKDGEEGKFGDSLGYIPFFRIDNNRKQTSHLKPVKDIIDDYDLMSCGLSNNIQDVSEAVWVVKGFQGDNLEEMIQNVKTKKHIGVEPDGDVDIKTISIPYEARKSKMEVDEKNIYRFGMGFNSAQLGDGNITNVVIKSRYALLDLKCNKLEIRLKAFLKNLVKIVLQEINEINDTDYQPKDVYFEFDREVMTNATDNATIEMTKAQTEQFRMTTLLNAASLLDEETVLKAICEILDIDFEEIKDKIPKQPATDLNAASEKLAGVVPQEGGDDGGGESV